MKNTYIFTKNFFFLNFYVSHELKIYNFLENCTKLTIKLASQKGNGTKKQNLLFHVLHWYTHILIPRQIFLLDLNSQELYDVISTR